MIASSRVMVYIQVWLTKTVLGANQIDSWWVDVTEGGSVAALAACAAQDAIEPLNIRTYVSQYHVYFADGGHARYKTTRAMKIDEDKMGPAQPLLAPNPLVPTPEELRAV